jgi:hypothetical protein
VGTIRLRLLKIAAEVRRSARRICLRLLIPGKRYSPPLTQLCVVESKLPRTFFLLLQSTATPAIKIRLLGSQLRRPYPFTQASLLDLLLRAVVTPFHDPIQLW